MPQEVKEEVRRQLVDPSGLPFLVPRGRAMMSLATGDKLAQMLFDMRWSLAKAEHGFFITCDNPLVRWVDPELVHPILRRRRLHEPHSPGDACARPENDPHPVVGRGQSRTVCHDARRRRLLEQRARVACGGVPLLACGARRHRAAREAVQGLASKGDNGGSRTGKVGGSCDAAQVEAEERIQTAVRGDDQDSLICGCIAQGYGACLTDGQTALAPHSALPLRFSPPVQIKDLAPGSKPIVSSIPSPELGRSRRRESAGRPVGFTVVWSTAEPRASGSMSSASWSRKC